MIGFFVNSLTLRGDLSGDPSFRELLSRVREVALSAYAHQDLPFEKLVDELQSDRDLSQSPLFQVMFALQNVPLDGLKHSDLSFSLEPLDVEVTRFDLEMYLSEQREGLGASLVYNTDLFDSADGGSDAGALPDSARRHRVGSRPAHFGASVAVFE